MQCVAAAYLYRGAVEVREPQPLLGMKGRYFAGKRLRSALGCGSGQDHRLKPQVPLGREGSAPTSRLVLFEVLGLDPIDRGHDEGSIEEVIAPFAGSLRDQ